jgi:hypothetical protein
MKLILIILTIIIYSCQSQAYPENKFRIDKGYRDLISPYSVGEVMVFKSNKGNIDTFIITKIDSSVDNVRGFIAPRPHKNIFVSYKQFPVDYWQHSRTEMGSNNSKPRKVIEDAWLLCVTKFPDDNSTELNFNFRTYFGCTLSQIIPLRTDTLKMNNIKFSNYYKISYCKEDIDDSSSVICAYSTVSKGLMAYEYKNGEKWARVN